MSKMTAKRFAGQHVVIVGGSSGIGLATAHQVYEEGGHITIAALQDNELTATASELPDACIIPVDVNDSGAVKTALSGIKSIDHFVVTAGQVTGSKLGERPQRELSASLDVRVWGSIYVLEAVHRALAPHGSVTLTSATSTSRPVPGIGLASASCGAIEALALTWALELAPTRVNVLVPGLIATPKLGAGGTEKQVDEVATRLPMRRVGKPEEAADAIAFLMTNDYVTGVILPVDGGLRII